jgi:protein-S-isoprenylcysteine O-methyltransferase Ste14
MIVIFAASAIALLAVAIMLFRSPVREDYRAMGRLSPFTAALQALLFFIYGGFPYLYVPDDWPAVHVNLVVRILGLAGIVLGLSALLIGMIQLGIRRSLGRRLDDMNQAGLYAISRNPQAVACGLYVIGFAILWPSLYALAWALLYVPIIHMMILTEEEHLRVAYGKKYERYLARVPRYLGLPKRS